MEKYRVLHRAMSVLAGQCDGAIKRDDVGFNGADAFIGHQMAAKPFELWTELDVILASGMLRKYHRQLEGVLDILNFTVELKIPSNKVITADGGLFIFQYKYDSELNATLKEEITAQGRHFDGNRKAWVVPASIVSAEQVIRFASDHGFVLTERAHQVVADAERGTLEPIPEAVLKPGDRRIVKDTEEFEGEILRVYFPYDSKVVDGIRPFPDRRFEAESKPKHWVVPFHAGLTFAETILEFADKFQFEMAPELRASLETVAEKRAENVVMSSQEDADIEVEGLLGTLRPFQRGGVAYAVRNKRTFIADEQGLGKTIQAIATIVHEDAYPAVIICPATLKINWEREFKAWVEGVKVQVISGLHEVVDDFNNEPKDVYIVNYDIFSNYLEELSDVLPRAIIFDESHYLKNSKSNRGKAAMKLVETTAAPIVLMLTGTPVLNRPRELWQQLKIMGRAAEFGSEWKFLKHYCQGESGGFGQDYDGAQNLEELNKRMRATCFIRRLKCNVMKELPAKQRSNVVVQIDNRSEYNRVLNDFWGWMESQGKGETSNNAEKLTQIEYLKQAAARGKLSAIKRWIRDFMESGEKLVVFAHHKEIQKSILAEFPTAAHIFGEDTMAARQVNVDRFQTDPTCQLMVASVKAAGVGLTLTAASNVVFCELGWTPAEHDQAEDRTHRIGQTESVNIYYMIATDTIDEDIMELLLEKKRVVGEATDGVYVGEEVPVQILSEVMKRLKVQWAERGKVSHINQELVLDLDEEEIVSNTKLVHDFEDLFKKQNTTNQDEARVQDKIGELNYKLDFSLDFPNSSMSEESLDQIFGKGPGNLDDPDSLYKDISI